MAAGVSWDSTHREIASESGRAKSLGRWLARVLVLALAVTPAPAARAADGPGLGNLSYATGELFEPIAVLTSPSGHGNAAMVNGYLMLIYSTDAGGTASDGGIDFWDVSDPRNPTLRARYDDVETHGLREAHGFGLAHGGDILAAQSLEGVQFWDVADPDDIALLAEIDLPGIEGGGYTGAWWVFWQDPYVYVAGQDQGLYVVDASDPANPSFVAQVPTSAFGGFNASMVYAVGNLLILMRHKEGKYATLDISDPASPSLITAFTDGMPGYSHLFAAGRVLTAGGDIGATHTLYVHELSADGTTFSYLGAGSQVCTLPGLGLVTLGAGGYGAYQDGNYFGGFGQMFAKFDIASRSLVGCGSSEIPERDEDFAQVLGNLVFIGNDHDGGSALHPHQLAPDTTGPEVEFVHPPDGATFVAASSRVGVSMSDNVDLASVDSSSFIVRPQGGSALSGRYSAQMGIVNFTPDQPFLSDTVYEVVVNGVADWAGNAGASFTSSFSTQLVDLPSCELAPTLVPTPVGVAVGLDLAAQTGAEPRTYSWDLGDGSPPTAPAATSSLAASWSAAGRYGVTLTVTNAFGSASCSAVQIVHEPLTAAAPTASSTIVHDGARSYNVNPDNDSVSAIDEDGFALRWRTAVGDDPQSLALAPGDALWVVNRGDATIDVLDREDGGWLASIPLPARSQPISVVFDPAGAHAYVALHASGRLLKLSPAGTVVGDVAIGPTPRGIAVSADSSRVFVSRFVSPSAQLHDPDDAGSLALPAGEVREVDAASFSVTRTFPLAFDPGPDSESSGRGVPNYVGAPRIHPSGTRALVPSKKDNVARGVFLDGQALTFESRTRAIVSELDLLGNSETLGARLDLDDRSLPRSVVYSPLGDVFFVAAQGSNTVEAFDAVDHGLLTSRTTGRGPQGLAVDVDGLGRTLLYSHDYLERAVSIFDVSDLVSGVANAMEPVAEVSTVALEALPPGVLEGKRIFYDASDPRMSRDGYTSCAGCHLDGGQDGQVWDFTQAGEGLRNTIDLRGKRGVLHGNVHWTANFDEIQDFERDIRESFGGSGFLSDPDYALTLDPLGLPKAGRSAALDALAAYLGFLARSPDSPYRNEDGSLSAQAESGRGLFGAKGCDACHGGMHFTDRLRHDVGTLSASSGQGSGAPLPGIGIETPTLKGLWATAPYLHDGQAQSLDEVLQNVQHAGSLSAGERADLVAYLELIDDGEPVPEPAALVGLCVGALMLRVLARRRS